MIIGFIVSWVSRKNEFQADLFATKNGMGGELKEGLIKLFKKDKSDVWPDKVYSMLTHSHPTLLQRIKAVDTTN